MLDHLCAPCYQERGEKLCVKNTISRKRNAPRIYRPWHNCRLRPSPARCVSRMYVDTEVLLAFRERAGQEEKEYQTLMNEALAAAMRPGSGTRNGRKTAAYPPGATSLDHCIRILLVKSLPQASAKTRSAAGLCPQQRALWAKWSYGGWRRGRLHE